MAERLDAFLAHRGHGSRSEVKARIRRGEVRVDGQVCRDPGVHVEATADIRVGDETVVDGIHEATLLLHKPVGYSCSHDQRESPTVDALIPASHRHLPIEWAGRLDRITSGLLVLTTEGDLIHRLTNPRRKLAKRYRIAYSGRLSSHAVERCAKGITLDGDPRPTLPAKLVLLDADGEGLGHALMTLHEGRYHQVRRMIAALGGEVVRLHRDRIGGLDLPGDLPAGAIRDLEPRERRLLLQTAEDDGALVREVRLGFRTR